MIESYPKIHAVGHRAIDLLFSSSVVVEEKVDGSQFAFGVIDGELQCRSRGKQVSVDAPDKMFALGVGTAKALAADLRPGWIYRGEYLARPKHNTLAYRRVPARHVALFDISPALGVYLSPGEKVAEAQRLGLECVPLLHEGRLDGTDSLRSFLDRESFLGGPKIEGVVVKNYAVITPEKTPAFGKLVSEAFKEVHQRGEIRAPQGDIITEIVTAYRTEPRWRKAVQHLRELGLLANEPRDIGKLVIEVQNDVLKEEREAIREALFAYFWPKIRGGIVTGFAEFYKALLAERAFEGAPA